MTGKFPVTYEQKLAYQKRQRALEGKFLDGIIEPQATLAGMQILIEQKGKLEFPLSKRQTSPNSKVIDPYIEYRKVKGLVFIGPDEIEKVFIGPKKKNPLNLQPGWCPKDIPMVTKIGDKEVSITPEIMVALLKLCQTKEWQTQPILFLELSRVAGQPTSLVNQYSWFGVRHDDNGPGIIRKDIMWSNYFIGKNYDWAINPAVIKPRWKIGYTEPPVWSRNLNWANQQENSKTRRLIIPSAASEALMLNIIAVSTGKKYRLNNYSRTCTIIDGCPLSVVSYDDSLHVYDYWSPEYVSGFLGLAVEGVPLELVF